MTKEQLIEKLKHYAKYENHEFARIEAESALIEYIGDPEIEAAFDDMNNWYV